MTNEEFIKSVSLEGEEWRDVVGYEDRYVVSSLGRIVSLLTHSVLKPHAGGYDGYRKITLYSDGTPKRYAVHRIVAQAFIPNPRNLPEVDHIDTDRANNIASNLRWTSPKENCNNPISINKHRIAMTGSRNPMFGKTFTTEHRKKLSLARKGKVYSDEERYKRYKPQKVVQLTLDGQFVRIWNSILDVTNFFVCQKSSIHSVIRGVNKSAKGYKWMYLSDYETLINKSKNS